MKNLMFSTLLISILVSCSLESKQDSFINNEEITEEDNIELSIDSLILQFKHIETDTLDCTAIPFWQVISYGSKSIPFLIESLTDTSKTKVYNRCKSSRLNTGEISYFALRTIISLPTYLITGIKYDVFDDDNCWSFNEYFFKDSNKFEYQLKVREFYKKEKGKFKPVKFPNHSINECFEKFNISEILMYRVDETTIDTQD